MGVVKAPSTAKTVDTQEHNKVGKRQNQVEVKTHYGNKKNKRTSSKTRQKKSSKSNTKNEQKQTKKTIHPKMRTISIQSSRKNTQKKKNQTQKKETILNTFLLKNRKKRPAQPAGQKKKALQQKL